MKYLIIVLLTCYFSATHVFAAEKNDCSELKKFSIQYTWCKSKNAGNTIKSKISKLGKDKTTIKQEQQIKGGLFFMRIIIIILTVVFFSINVVNSEEEENCKDYKISLKALKCNIDNASANTKRRMTTKDDGSQNFLGKWFNAKSLADVIK